MGQINPDSGFGRVLTDLAANEKYTTFCEVGTWNGQGSTRCLVMGLQSRKTFGELWSYEANAEMYDKAIQYWNPKPMVLHLVHGTLHRKIPELDPSHPGLVRIQKHYGQQYLGWYAGEKRSLLQAPLVSPPTNADVVVLDGGEFTTRGDYEVLSQLNPKVIALDDTSVYKTYDIREELLRSPEWRVLHDVPGDRKGWAVFERVLPRVNDA